jgi:hypothetical protein
VSTSGTSISIKSNGLPEHKKTPYWGSWKYCTVTQRCNNTMWHRPPWLFGRQTYLLLQLMKKPHWSYWFSAPNGVLTWCLKGNVALDALTNFDFSGAVGREDTVCWEDIQQQMIQVVGFFRDGFPVVRRKTTWFPYLQT